MLNIVFLDDLDTVLTSQTQSFFQCLLNNDIAVDVDNSTFTLSSNDDVFEILVSKQRLVLGRDFLSLNDEQRNDYLLNNLVLPEGKTLFVIDLCLDEENELLETGCEAGKRIPTLTEHHDFYEVLYTTANAQFYEPANSSYDGISYLNFVPRAKKPDCTFDNNFPSEKISPLRLMDWHALGEPVNSLIIKLLESRRLNEQLFGAIIMKVMRLANGI